MGDEAMRTLRLSALTEDLFEIRGTFGDEPSVRAPGVAEIKDASGNGLRIHYGRGGLLGIAPLSEDDPIPDWDIRFHRWGDGYLFDLVLEAPDSAVVSEIEGY